MSRLAERFPRTGPNWWLLSAVAGTAITGIGIILLPHNYIHAIGMIIMGISAALLAIYGDYCARKSAFQGLWDARKEK